MAVEQEAVQHTPNFATWEIVHRAERYVVLSAMCACGDETCHWTSTSHVTTGWVCSSEPVNLVYELPHVAAAPAGRRAA
jgi:hypothetical protein